SLPNLQMGSEGFEPSSHRLKGEYVAVTPRPRCLTGPMFPALTHELSPDSLLADFVRIPARAPAFSRIRLQEGYAGKRMVRGLAGKKAARQKPEERAGFGFKQRSPVE